LYKKAGARYFVAMANHHDNFDNFNSKYQPWNAVRMGPKKDLIAGWARAAKNNGLPFGVSIHGSHAWTWYEVAQRADMTGPMAGVPYDGKLTKEAGKGAWWEGWDPQALYAQDHVPAQERNMSKMWDWGNGAVPPTKAYIEKFHRRTLQLIDDYGPDLLYFDDSKLPFWPIDPAGLEIAAYMYNHSMKKHGGKLEAVIEGKILEEAQRRAMVWDVERGASNRIEPLPWQTDTCIGNWHYDRRVYDRDGYKSAKTVIHTLADVVSKNGNLLLNIPVRGDGTIDEKEEKVVEGITAWMDKYSEAIYDTRPWKIFGEGPAMAGAAELKAQGFNEGKGKPFTGEDMRFTSKGDLLYVIALGAPIEGKLRIRSLAAGSEHFPGQVGQVSLVGRSQPLVFHRDGEALTVEMPEDIAGEFTYAVKIR
jgi:alpha-L-fucosidase